jgi:hypothetical protein
MRRVRKVRRKSGMKRRRLVLRRRRRERGMDTMDIKLDCEDGHIECRCSSSPHEVLSDGALFRFDGRYMYDCLLSCECVPALPNTVNCTARMCNNTSRRSKAEDLSPLRCTKISSRSKLLSKK